MSSRRHIGIAAWACILALLVQSLAAPLLAGRAAAAQVDPFAGIPICGTPATGGERSGGAPADRHDGHGLAGECCFAGCCQGPLSATLPQPTEIGAPAEIVAAPFRLDRTTAAVPRRANTGTYARAPPIRL